MRQKLESRIEILLICRKEEMDHYRVDLAQCPWHTGDSTNALKGTGDKPKRCKDFPPFMKRISFEGGSGGQFRGNHTKQYL